MSRIVAGLGARDRPASPFGFKSGATSADAEPMRNRISRVCLAGLSLAFGLVGCAGKRDAAWVHENLELTENFHASTMVLETPRIPENAPHIAKLRATGRTRGPKVGADIELVVRAEFKDYSFLDRVSFSNGRAYPLEVEKREVEDCGTTDPSLCNVHEFVSVALSRDFLKAKRMTGFKAKLWGRRNSVVVTVPAHFIEGLLARMENREPTVAPATPGAVPAAPDPGAARRN